MRCRVCFTHRIQKDSDDAFSPDPYNNPLCGKQLQARYGSKTVTATVKDRCGSFVVYCRGADFSRETKLIFFPAHSCDGTHIDLTPSA